MSSSIDQTLLCHLLDWSEPSFPDCSCSAFCVCLYTILPRTSPRTVNSCHGYPHCIPNPNAYFSSAEVGLLVSIFHKTPGSPEWADVSVMSSRQDQGNISRDHNHKRLLSTRWTTVFTHIGLVLELVPDVEPFWFFLSRTDVSVFAKYLICLVKNIWIYHLFRYKITRFLTCFITCIIFVSEITVDAA